MPTLLRYHADLHDHLLEADSTVATNCRCASKSVNKQEARGRSQNVQAPDMIAQDRKKAVPGGGTAFLDQLG